ncbi:uncharacterized protein PADG_02708 [Paracoccidioides brasiliensis Pb18]|uniref:Uncharacterized protein n=1 Tax=Paracoccidioides brasiliensis (strain Pb18) TaxID=502780 RepID=C1G6A3_PARBD|nr:uncharacterized protein PADG_02708 [Paracoccidioides brasiliensis Pb18]EEH46610.2 hypothetical protein PADG_02708 [Paracoccidioides brasiliensis Pb18]ODH51115.1 hypothetical protein GX48_02727 [Paracoccidioides brasiliensis]
MVIGYLAVSAKRAKDFNKYKTLTWRAKRDNNTEQVKARKGEWYCVVQAEKAAMEPVAKLWVPQKHEHKRFLEKTNNNPYLWN